jgi:NB-ARC domain/TIR domain
MNPIRYDAFLSYARTDDEAFVERLYRRLSHDEFRVWFDRERMSNRGQTFLQEIRDRIAESDRFLAVIGPAALASEYVRAEWAHASLFARSVVPIVRLGAPADLPRELRRFHAPDFRDDAAFEEAVAGLERILREPVPEPGPLRTTPPLLPLSFLPRVAALDAIQERVLADIEHPVTVPPNRRITSLVGMPGAGKSVLAAAFARATATRLAFARDGIVWLSVGQHPTPGLVVRLLGAAFGVDLGFDESVSAARLAPTLANRSCLIVLDDVWDVRDAEPVVNACDITTRVLITTRDRNLANRFSDRPMVVGALDEAEALRLLAGYARIEAELPPEAVDVARECGYLPFGLALCGAMVADDHSWSDVRDAMRAADLRFISAVLPNYPYTDLLRAQQVSVATLSEDVADRYRDLVVFPADRAVPERAVVTLWSRAALSESEGRRILAVLRGKSLIELTGVAPSRTLSLHDLQHDYLAAVTPDARQRHSSLLDCYHQRTVGGQWHTLDDDGHIGAHLTWHMTQAGRDEEIESVLRETTREGRNGWYEAAARRGELPAFVADVRRGWDWAKRQDQKSIDHDGHARFLAAEIRSALSLSSVANRVAMFPAPLLAASVQYGALEWKQATSMAALQVEPRLRAQAWTALARVAPPDRLLEVQKAALDAVREIDSGRERLSIVAELVQTTVLADPVRADVLAICSTGGVRGAAIVARIAPGLSGALLGDARRIAKAFDDPLSRVVALSALAPRLPDDQRTQAVSELIADVDSMATDHRKVQALCAIAPVWHEAVDRAVEIAGAVVTRDDLASFSSNGSVFVALAAVPSLTATQWVEVLRLLSVAQLNMDNMTRALCALGPRLNDEERRAIVAPRVKRRTGDDLTFRPPGDELRAFYLPDSDRLSALREHLGALVSEAGEAFNPMSLGDDWQKRESLRLLRELPDSLVGEALASATRLRDDAGRAEVIAALLPRADVGARGEELGSERRRLEQIGDVGPQARAIAAFVPYLERPDRARVAWDAFQMNVDATTSSPVDLSLSVDLYPFLTQGKEAAIAAMLAKARGSREPRARDHALALVSRHLPDSAVPDVLNEADQLAAGGHYQALAALMGRAPEESRPARISVVLDAAERAAGELPADFAAAVERLAPSLTPTVAERVLRIANGIHEPHRSAVQARIAPVEPAGVPPSPGSAAERLAELQERLEGALRPVVAGRIGGTTFLKPQPRSSLLAELAAAARLVATLGDGKTPTELVEAIRQTASWWP